MRTSPLFINITIRHENLRHTHIYLKLLTMHLIIYFAEVTKLVLYLILSRVPYSLIFKNLEPICCYKLHASRLMGTILKAQENNDGCC